MRDRPGPIAAIVMSLVLIAILVGVNRGAGALADLFSTEAIWGFIAGVLFCVAVYGLIVWIDPASRPRGSGSSTDQ